MAQNLLITKNGATEIQAIAGTFSITKELDHRSFSCAFRTEDAIAENDEIVVTNAAATVLFAGVIEKVQIDGRNNLTIRSVVSSGWKRLFDRKLIAESYANILAGDIVKDIIANWTEGFTEGTIEDGATIVSAPINYKTPSDAISALANKIGFTWYIDNNRAVHFKLRTRDTAPETITDTSANYKDLKLIPEVSELANSIIVRGGSFLSTTQTKSFVGNGETTAFLLPEKPKDVSVTVGGVAKTLGIKFGELTPTTDFVVSYEEKYIENGTLAVLGVGAVLEVSYKYDVPIRLRVRDSASIAAMAALFPGTDGIFEKLIEDDTLDSRELATSLAEEHLRLFANATIKGSFSTENAGFEPGQVLTIAARGVNTSAVIESVTMSSLGNGYFEYNVDFATVLFNFEDFLRTLLTRGKLKLDDSELVELIELLEDTLTLAETITLTVDENRVIDTIELSESISATKNFAVEYVWAPYFPASHADTKRQFILDASPLA